MRVTSDNLNFSLKMKCVAIFKEAHLFVLAKTGLRGDYEFVSMMIGVDVHEVLKNDAYYSKSPEKSVELALNNNEILFVADSYTQLYEYIVNNPPVFRVEMQEN